MMCSEHRATDIGPNTDVGIVVGLDDPWFRPHFPGRASLAGHRQRQLHGWSDHLQVKTEAARAGGVELFNYPKFLAGITFEQSESQRVCRMSEGQEHILALTGERIPTPGDARGIPRPPGVPVEQRKQLPRFQPAPVAGMHGHVRARHQVGSSSVSASALDEDVCWYAQDGCLQGTAEGSR